MANSDLSYSITSSYDGKGVDAAATQLSALKKQLDDLQSQRLQITADATQVEAQIANVKRDIAQLNTSVKLGMDDSDAEARLAELKAKLQELQDKLLEIRADNADAMAKIAETKVAIDAIPNKKTTELDVNGDPAKAALKSAVNDMDNAQKSMSDDWNRTKSAGTAATFSIATAVTALVAAMMPVGVAAIGLGGSMVSGFGSAGVAAGAFGLSLKSTLTSAMNIVTSTNSLNQTLAAQRAELATLTPGSAAYNSALKSIGATQAELNTVQQQGTTVQNQTAQSILSLEAEWKKLQGTMEQATGPLIQEGIQIIAVAMKSMPALVESVSSALKPLLDQLKGFADGGGFTKFVQWIEQVGVPNLKTAVQVISNLVKMVAEIAVAFGDQGTNMMNLLEKVTAEIDKWGANGGFARFAGQVQSMLPEVDQFLKALFEALQNVTKALVQMGPTSLSMLSIVLRLAASMPVGVVQAFFAAFAAYKVVALAVTAVSALSTVTKAMGLAFKGAQIIMESFTAAQKGITVATDEGAASQTLMKIGTLASAAATKVNAAATAVSKTAQEAWNTVTKEGIVAATAAKVEAMAQAVADGIATAATWAWNAAQSVWDALMSPIIVTIGLVVIAIAAIGVAIYELVDHWTTVWNAIKDVGLDIWDGIKTAFVAIWDGIKIAAIAVWDFIKKYWMDFLEALSPVGWGLFIYQHWSEIWGEIKGVVQPILDFLKGIWQDFLNAMSTAWNAVSSTLKNSWDTVWNGIKSTVNTIWAWLKATWDTIINGIKATWDTVSSALKSSWDTMWNAAKATVDTIWAWLKATWDTIIDGIKATWDTVSAALKSSWDTMWNAAKATVDTIWAWLKATWDTIINGIKATWDTVSSALKSSWDTVWNDAKSTVDTIWAWLKATWDTCINGIKATWDTVSAALKTAWNTVWTGLKSDLQVAVNGLKTIWNDIEKVFGTPIEFVIKTVLNGGIIKAINWVIGHLGGSSTAVGDIPDPGLPTFSAGGHVQGPGTGTSDSIVARVSHGEYIMPAQRTAEIGVHNLDAMRSGTMPGFAGGGAVSLPNPTSPAVGPGSGTQGGAIGGQPVKGGVVTTPSPAPGTVGGAPTGLTDADLQSGFADIIETVGGAAAGVFSQMLGGAAGIATAVANVANDVKNANIPVISTIAGFFGSGASKVASFADAMKAAVAGWGQSEWDKGTDGIIKLVDDKLINNIPGTSGPLNIGKNIMTTIANGGMTKARDLMSTFLFGQDQKYNPQSQIGGVIPSGAQKALIDSALAADGISQSAWAEWEAGLNTLITRESNWNAGAQNNSDSNAAAGTPSQGLMQIIAPTFAAYRNPSLPDNVFDAEANIAAGIRYIMAVYGGINNVQQANANLPPKGYDIGGPLMPGLTLANNTTGTVEGVLSPTGMAAVGGISGLSALNSGNSASVGTGAAVGMNVEININGSNASAEDIVQEIEDELLPRITVALKQMAGTR